MRRPLIALLVLTACAPAEVHRAPVRLTPAGDTLHVPFSEITAAAWLGGERFALLSAPDDAVALVDFDTRRVQTLGAGTGQLQHPASLFTLGDSVFTGDWGLRRITVWNRDGLLVRNIPADTAARGALARAVDAAGRMYYEIPPPPSRDGSSARDSAAVARVTPGSAPLDTIARLGPLDIAPVRTEQGTRFQRRILSGQDLWGVLPDGTLWIARVYQNRVDRRAPDGTVSRGSGLPDRILLVTDTDRARWADRLPPSLRGSVTELPFAVTKPPFVMAFAAPDSSVWLVKSRAVTDTVQWYQVAEPGGGLRVEYETSGWQRVVAVTPRETLIALGDSSGYQLMRAPLPRR